MDAAREIREHVIALPVDCGLDTHRRLGFFIMFVAVFFLIQEFGRSSADNSDHFTAFVMFILGLWMLMISFILRMFPRAQQQLALFL